VTEQLRKSWNHLPEDKERVAGDAPLKLFSICLVIPYFHLLQDFGLHRDHDGGNAFSLYQVLVLEGCHAILLCLHLVIKCPVNPFDDK